MIWLKSHLTEIYAGAPAWAWLALAGILLFENWLANSKYKSNSTIQLVLGWLGYVPVIGPLLRSRTVAVTVTEEVKPGPSGPVSMKLLPFLLLAGLGMSACGVALQRGVTAGAQIGEGATAVITATDVAKDADAVALAQKGDEVGAKKLLSDWHPIRAKLRGAVRGFYAVLLVVEASIAAALDGKGKADYAALLGQIAEAARQLVQAFKTAGVALPAFVGAL